MLHLRQDRQICISLCDTSQNFFNYHTIRSISPALNSLPSSARTSSTSPWSGRSGNIHAYCTNIAGEWDTAMAAVKRCHEEVHAMGAPRISTTIKLGTRTDRNQTMKDKLVSVREKLG